MYTILIVDETVYMRKWIAGILHNTKYKVIAEASYGSEVINQYYIYQPELVLLDVKMDEMDGVHALKHLVKIFTGVKVIMCSSLGHQAYINECLKIGAKDFIVKPYFKDLLPILDRIAG